MYSMITEDAKDIMEKVDSKKIKITRAKLSDKIDIRLLRALNNSVLETHINGDYALYFSGKSLGTELAKTSKKDFHGVEEVMGFVKDVFKRMMIGIVVDATIAEGRVELKVGECAFCQARIGMMKEGMKCHFLAGLVSGILSEALAKKYIGEEINCRSAGDRFCIFEFSEAKDDSELIETDDTISRKRR